MFVSCVKTCDRIRLDEGGRTYTERWSGPCTIRRLMGYDVEVGGFGEVKEEFSAVAQYVFERMLAHSRFLEGKVKTSSGFWRPKRKVASRWTLF